MAPPLKSQKGEGCELSFPTRAPNADASKHPHVFNQPRDGALGGAGLDSILCKKTRKCLIRDRGRRGCLRRSSVSGQTFTFPAASLPFTSSGQKRRLALKLSVATFPSAVNPALYQCPGVLRACGLFLGSLQNQKEIREGSGRISQK